MGPAAGQAARRTRWWFALLAIAVLCAPAWPLRAAVTVQSLDAGWQFRLAPDDAQAKAHPDTTRWMAATVPGSAQTDLMALKLLPDPYWRMNTRAMAWVGHAGWQYRKRFQVDAATLARAHVDLVFDGLDTFATVYVNGHEVLRADNMFRRWRVPARRWLHAGGNTLQVDFASPIEHLLPWLRRQPYVLPGEFPPRFGLTPKNLMSQTYVRKAAYQYGWDWGPRVITEGIWQPVTLESWNDLRLRDFHVAQPRVTAERATLRAGLDIESDRVQPVTVRITWRAPDGTTGTLQQAATLRAGDNDVEVPIDIAHPERWWPAGYGPPNLYTFAAVVAGADGATLASATQTTGLRSVVLRQAKDQWGTSFEFVVNGVPVFAKGANFIPMDVFPTRVTDARIDHLLTSARDAHMNMLRIWGGGYYLPDHFYAEADKLGLMVWQEFMFGGSVTPPDAALRDNTRIEAIQQVKRLRDHPSIVIWVGNNEVETGWQAWPDRIKFKQSITPAQRAAIEQGMHELFDVTLRDVVAKYAPGVPYQPTSPGTANATGPVNVLDAGDYHYWDVWSGKALPATAYLDVTPRFMTEYGLQSLPAMATIDAFTEPADRHIDSDVMRWHEKFVGGTERLLKYVEREFGPPRSFADLVYLSQVMQAEGIQLAAEHLRASRPRSMGSLYWQLNDDWPGTTWSSIDYYGRWKLLQWHAKRFYAPLLAAALRNHGTTALTLVSDRTAPVAAQWRLEVMDFAGKLLAQRQADLALPPLSATRVATLSDAALLKGADPRATFAVFELRVAGRVVSRNLVFFDPAKDLALPVPHVHAELAAAGAGFTLTLSSDRLAREVWISFGKLPATLSDNGFNLLPGEKVTLTVQSRAGLAELRQALRVQDLAAAMGRGAGGSAP